jgi:hypothetical protein
MSMQDAGPGNINDQFDLGRPEFEPTPIPTNIQDFGASTVSKWIGYVWFCPFQHRATSTCGITFRSIPTPAHSATLMRLPCQLPEFL